MNSIKKVKVISIDNKLFGIDDRIKNYSTVINIETDEISKVIKMKFIKSAGILKNLGDRKNILSLLLRNKKGIENWKDDITNFKHVVGAISTNAKWVKAGDEIEVIENYAYASEPTDLPLLKVKCQCCNSYC